MDFHYCSISSLTTCPVEIFLPITESSETFTVSIKKTDNTIVATSNSVTINDTSVGYTPDPSPLYFASGSGLSFSGVIIALE